MSSFRNQVKMSLWAEKTVGSKSLCASYKFEGSMKPTHPSVYYRYSTFVNWELWWPNFPILVYFKETQTKPEGQVHFFPVIFVSIS